MDNGKRFSSSSGSSDKPQTTLPSKKPPPSGKKSSYNRVRVQDLLNEEDSSLSRSTPNTGGFSRDKGTVPSSNGQRILQDYECESPQCGRIFVSKGSLSAHKRTCRPAPTPFVCTQCNTSFSSNANLNKHIRTVHNKEKPFKCDHCDSAFAFRDGRTRHVRMVHDQLRPYTCTFCSIKFKTSSHLKKHILARHPEHNDSANGNGEGLIAGSSARRK